MLTGNLTLTYDLNKVPIYSSNHVIVALVEDKNLVQQIGAVQASILLPPYEAMEAEMNNNPALFHEIYNAHLFSYEANKFIGALLTALYQGKNICLYISTESMELLFNKELINFFANNYGINIQPDAQVFYSYNQNIYQLLNIIENMYIYDYITPDEVFILIPKGALISEAIVQKLIAQTNSPILNSIEEYSRYFFDYKERIKDNNNIPLVMGITFGGNL